MIRLTPIASDTSSTARRSVNAPRSSSNRIARCFSSRAEHRQSGTELALDTLDEPVERAVQRRHADDGHLDALPLQRQVAGLALLERHELCAERFDDRLHREHQRMTGQLHGSTRSADSEMCVAPCANAAAMTAPTIAGACSAGNGAAAAERTELDHGPQRFGGRNRLEDVRAWMALDEGLDGELERQH